MSLATTVSEKANLIWAIADKLTGTYKPHEYGEVILPLTVIKRFDSVLSDTKPKLLEKMKSFSRVSSPDALDTLLENVSGYNFYNKSKFTFETLLDDPDNIETNFRDYLNGFSRNVQDIIEKFEFDKHITKMASKNILYIVLKEFTTPEADLHPSKVSNLEMGYIFEEITRRFSEAHNEDAGQHYTPREVIRLMVNILFIYDNDVLTGKDVTKTLYDPACGTGGMLSVAQEYLHKLNSDAQLVGFGQEINDQTFAICQSDVLIKGGDPSNIKDANTLSDDQFTGFTFDYILSNPPFGREWKNDKDKVEHEARLGNAGRFFMGLPAINDGQMLFLETAISKMKSKANGGSRIAIIHNGSPLFTGDAGSGPSEIRKYIIENDLLDAIVALPNDIFYNTGIATYIWVLTNNKPAWRKGKVQLINANELYEKRRKSLGNKRNDIPQEAIDKITNIYGDFKPNEISKIFDNEDFGYTKITVERPLRLNFKVDAERIRKVQEQTQVSKLATSLKPDEKYLYEHLIKALESMDYDAIYMNREEFAKLLKKTLKAKLISGVKTPVMKAIMEGLSERDPQADICLDADGKPEADPELRDTENVPLKEDIEEYFKREVLPFAPDAWIDYSKNIVGYEIPFTRYFYKYTPPRPSKEIMEEIRGLEQELSGSIEEIFKA